MPSKESRIVGSPLTPVMLADLGALEEIPAAPDGFRPEGEWTSTYQIWTCHGYTDDGNEDEGFLRIARSEDAAEGQFTLRVDQGILHDGANLHMLRARIECALDPWASPLAWELSSRFTDSSGKPRHELHRQEQATVAAGTLEVTVDDSPAQRIPLPRATTADWCLFEALQRMPQGPDAVGPVDVLDGLRIPRTRQTIRYCGLDSTADNALGGPLHRLQMLGSGTLPYDFWLDDQQRLVIVTTGARAYILDDRALEKFDTSVAGSRRYEQRRQLERQAKEAS